MTASTDQYLLGRQLRRFYEAHVDVIYHWGFTMEDITLLILCPLRQGKAGEERYPECWLVERNALNQDRDRWRRLMRELHPSETGGSAKEAQSPEISEHVAEEASAKGFFNKIVSLPLAWTNFKQRR
ncbi:hypothetical protein ACJZ2D_014913 [Fusarium nematophilum]